MNLLMHNRALLRGILAGAVVLAGASACSRSDRAGTGRDTTTATAQTGTPRQSTPSRRRAGPDTTVKSGEEAVSGYRGMERDSSARVSSDSSVGATPDTTSAEVAGTGAASSLDSAGVTSDYALTADTSAAGYSEMAPDTSSAAGLGDTATVALTDTTAQAPSDTATDTLTVATADSAADTARAQGEQAVAPNANADTLQDNAGRIRPPEDSTEIQGNVTSAQDRAEATSREAPTDAAGAAAVGNAVTGIDAVSLMTRAGARCVVKDESSDVLWDMADSPAASNPCGTGAMTLSLVRTGEK